MGHANFGAPQFFLGALRATMFFLEFCHGNTKICLGALRAPIITHAGPLQKNFWADVGTWDKLSRRAIKGGLGHGIGESWEIYRGGRVVG